MLAIENRKPHKNWNSFVEILLWFSNLLMRALPKIPGHSVTKLSAWENFGARWMMLIVLIVQILLCWMHVIIFLRFLTNQLCICAKYKRSNGPNTISWLFFYTNYIESKIFAILYAQVHVCKSLIPPEKESNPADLVAVAADFLWRGEHPVWQCCNWPQLSPVLGVFLLAQQIRRSEYKWSIGDVITSHHESPRHNAKE